MLNDKSIVWLLRIYLLLVFVFIFMPIVTSVVFSFNSDRFPSLPLGHFTWHWYDKVYNDPETWDAIKTSIVVALSASLLATIIGFCTAYTDFRYNFKFKNAYLALALLPPTIPLIILALAMLAWFSKLGISGQIWALIIAHTVLGAPFAMAIIRLRLQQMDKDLESAAWNLGASEWATMRHVIIPFALPSIISALCLTMAVSFDEFAIAWFVSGLNKSVPVVILEILQGNVDPQINAIGSFVFATTMTLVVIAQLFLFTKNPQ
ncbi:MAG: ABC transporter permease [Gammaproteobacteria bacterium]|jgi:spermidine/putrescine transport system permease protein|tara:strand:- start:1860 stop:2648 length:789 start_codon:yes stop_codon:yes gene_type:complete